MTKYRITVWGAQYGPEFETLEKAVTWWNDHEDRQGPKIEKLVVRESEWETM